jgi:integrase
VGDPSPSGPSAIWRPRVARRGPGEGNVYRRADGRWVARLQLGYSGGRRLRKHFYGLTRREVQDKLDRAKLDVQQGLPVGVDGRLTLAEYLRQWLADVVRPSVRPSTYTAYEMHVRLHLVPELGRVRLAKLTPQQVQSLLNRKLAEGLSPGSVHHLRAVLRRALNQAMRWDLVPRNVATLVDPPRIPRREVHAMTPVEARRLLALVSSDRLGALYAVALVVGLRQGEALGLTWDDVDLEVGRLTVRRALQRVNGRLQFVEPKSSRASRTIALPPTIVAELRAHRVRQLEERVWAGARWHEHGLIFASSIGTLDGMNVTHRLQRMLKDAGLSPMRFHDLRHASASLLLAQGVHPRVVMEILGHSQISLTMNTYSHVIPSLQVEAAARMEELLGQREAVPEAGGAG